VPAMNLRLEPLYCLHAKLMFLLQKLAKGTRMLLLLRISQPGPSLLQVDAAQLATSGSLEGLCCQ
jgi:hypothetical protein